MENKHWPNSVRIEMIEKSHSYNNPTVYQYGYYDGYQKMYAKFKEKQKALDAIIARINGEWDNEALLSFGVLGDNIENDIKRIATQQ